MDSPDQAAGESQRLEDRRQPDRDWRRFLDRAVHDLGAPLRGIGTSAGLLSEMYGDTLNDDARQLVQGVLDGVGRIDALLKALSDYSMALQLDGYSVGPVPGEGVVRSALDTIEAMVRDTGARVDYSPLPSVTGNWDQLSVLFRNLLQNALQYRGAASPRVIVSADRDGDAWRFAVKDNGIGIENQYWDRIFVPFERLRTSHKTGAGLGLAICKSIVELHGGRIWVESRVGYGSTFFFTLPEAGGER